MKYTRNTDPQLYIDHQRETNCGSFALNLCEWYEPEIDVCDEDYLYDWLYELALEGADPIEVANRYNEAVFERVGYEFDIEDAEYAFGEPVAIEGKELIGLRAYCEFEADEFEEYWDIEWDFHFRVFRDGKWMEKNGSQAVHECDINDWGKYNSDTIYFYHRIA